MLTNIKPKIALLAAMALAAVVWSPPAACREGGDALAPMLVPRQPPPAAPSVVEVKPLPPPQKPAPEPAKYGPEATALLLNYCRESLYKIVEFNDRSVLDEEYGKLVNNIDITRIQDDETAQLIGGLLTELNTLKLSETEKQYLMDAYNRRIQAGVLDALTKGKWPKDTKVFSALGGGPATMACQAIVFIASSIADFRSGAAKLQQEAAKRSLQLEADALNRLTVLRTQFFDTEYKLYRRHSLPDKLDLKEVQMAQYIKVLADEDPGRRLERLERLKDDFDAFPPFWYQIGKAAQETKNTLLARSYYGHFERIKMRVFREDLDYVLLCMHRILLCDPEKDQEAIRADLRHIEENTKYYYKWENILFAALMYARLGDLNSARRLIRMSINEGYCVPLHEKVLSEIEADAADKGLQPLVRRPEDLVAQSDGEAKDDLSRVGPGQPLAALREVEQQIVGIKVSVAPRSHAGQNASYFVPGYNLYAVGRALQGGAYNDNCVVEMPIDWFAPGKPALRLVFRGKAFKPADIEMDRPAGVARVTFARVLKRKDIVERKQELPITLRIERGGLNLGVKFQLRPVTPELLERRPELTPGTACCEIRAVTYHDRTFKVEDGMILYKP